MNETIRRVLVWPGQLRLAHGLIALPTLALIATGLLIRHTPSVADAASRLHGMMAALLTAGLLLRVWLLFTDKTSGQWRALIPGRGQIDAMLDMLKFYISFGRSPLPAWHAHNPFWMPFYAMVLLLLTLMALSGYLMPSHPLVFSLIYLPALHRGVATLILIFTAAHFVASLLHDLKGEGSDISGIINGYRIFILRREKSDQIAPVKFFRKDGK